MYRNVLAGQQQPYFLESGEGQRFLLGPFLATIIGHRLDTGSLMEGVVLIGAKDSASILVVVVLSPNRRLLLIQLQPARTVAQSTLAAGSASDPTVRPLSACPPLRR